ncbi:phage tail tape measure protein, partial [Burkholderia thailandensis]|nr:phage tail tape measure protein [Burkholderia thailandensis]
HVGGRSRGENEKSRGTGRRIDGFGAATSDGEALRGELVSAAGAIGTAGLASQKGAQALAAMDAAARGAGEGVRLLSDANNFFGGGMASEAWEKYVHKLREEPDVIGMTARQKAEYDARTKGANDAPARMAGLADGLAQPYKTLDKAIAETASKDAAGARTTTEQRTRRAPSAQQPPRG